jgi:hypothetical protein
MLKPGSQRSLSVAAEAITFEGALGYIKIQNSHFTNHGDHCINVHDPFSFFGFEVLDGNTIKISEYDVFYVQYEVGDELSFRNMDLSDTGFKASIIAIGGVGGTELRFDRPIPASISAADTKQIAIFNGKWTAGQVIVRNNGTFPPKQS